MIMSRYDYEYYSLSVNNLDAQTHDITTHEPNKSLMKSETAQLLQNVKIMILVLIISRLI